MLYKKPENVRYVDMAIFIDQVAYDENIDQATQEKVYEYIYHLTKMLAMKSRFFNKSHYYEEFAIYSATRTYLRLTSPKQFQVDEEGVPKLKPIKSILNYIKAVIYPHKVDFEQEFYTQTLQPIDNPEELVCASPYSFVDRLYESTDRLATVEFNICLDDVCSTAKKFLSKIPYSKNSSMWYNIYLSCLLTFLDSITLSNTEKAKVARLKTSYEYKMRYVEKIYKAQSIGTPILYHLDKSMSNYIRVLTTEMKHAISSDLSSLTHTYIPSTSGMNRLMLADINSEDMEDIE